MDEFEIKNDVPAPRRVNSQSGALAATLGKVEVGAYFDVPVALRKHLSWYSWAHRQKNPLVQFISRTVEDSHGRRVVRVWRLPDLDQKPVVEVGFTDDMRKQLLALNVGEELWLPYVEVDEVQTFLKENTPHEWGAHFTRKQYKRKMARGLTVFRKT